MTSALFYHDLCMLCVAGLVLVSVLLASAWLLMFTLTEARRQRGRRRRLERKETRGEGGTALQLARELQDRFTDPNMSAEINSDYPDASLYLTDAMLFDHARFRSQYERIPDDYPDAFTINRARIMEEHRLLEFFSENREVDCLIRNLFRRCYSHHILSS